MPPPLAASTLVTVSACEARRPRTTNSLRVRRVCTEDPVCLLIAKKSAEIYKSIFSCDCPAVRHSPAAHHASVTNDMHHRHHNRIDCFSDSFFLAVRCACLLLVLKLRRSDSSIGAYAKGSLRMRTTRKCLLAGNSLEIATASLRICVDVARRTPPTTSPIQAHDCSSAHLTTCRSGISVRSTALGSRDALFV